MTTDSHRTGLLAETRVDADRLDALAGRVPTADARDELVVHAPAVDEPLGAVPECTEADVESAVERARRAQAEWAERPPERRAAALDRLADLVVDRQPALLDLLQLETGKSRRDAVEELLDLRVACGYAARRGPALLAPERREPAIPLATTAEVRHEPVGVVGVIAPWNYPLTLSIGDAIPALVAGNAVVVKPDERTPFAALALSELLDAAGAPSGLLSVVTGDGATVGPALVDRVDHVAFTGSVETGRLVAERAGRNLVDCTLELGGKNPLVVLADADLEAAARGAVQSAFTNAGQLCLAAERIYVEESAYDDFLDALVGATRRLELGASFDYGPDVGSLIGPDQLERTREHVEGAVDDGADLLTGGRHRPDLGPFYHEPTVLADVERDAAVACEETFGPVASVWPVADAEAAVEAANDSEYGLWGSVWTRDRERGAAIARRIDCGTVCVDDAYAAGWGAVDAPMGGVGDSGLGRRHGPEGLRAFVEPRTVATSRVGPLVEVPWLPSRWFVRGLSSVVRLRRRLPGWLR